MEEFRTIYTEGVERSVLGPLNGVDTERTYKVETSGIDDNVFVSTWGGELEVPKQDIPILIDVLTDFVNLK